MMFLSANIVAKWFLLSMLLQNGTQNIALFFSFPFFFVWVLIIFFFFFFSFLVNLDFILNFNFVFVAEIHICGYLCS